MWLPFLLRSQPTLDKIRDPLHILYLRERQPGTCLGGERFQLLKCLVLKHVVSYGAHLVKLLNDWELAVEVSHLLLLVTLGNGDRVGGQSSASRCGVSQRLAWPIDLEVLVEFSLRGRKLVLRGLLTQALLLVLGAAPQLKVTAGDVALLEKVHLLAV